MKIRYLKTQNHIYKDHLTSQRQNRFDRYTQRLRSRTQSYSKKMEFPTNYSIHFKNAYLFVLIHLKKALSSKNKLAINIPDICVFHGGVVYDVLYSHNGDIKGLKTKQRLRLKQAYQFFINRSKEFNIKKQQQIVACFEDQQFLIMSDEDLFLVSRKNKNDPFFQKLQYLRNKINCSGQLFQITYNQEIDCQFAGEAMVCFTGYLSQEEMLNKYGQEKYLKYCNQKITMFLNYQQNIRIKKATFCYSKCQSNKYYLTNVKDIDYHNLTQAIGLRNQRLRREELARSKLLEMSPQKYERYKSQQNNPQVLEMQTEMDSQLYRMTDKLKLKTNLRQIIEQKKTQQAFKKLYPNHGQSIPNIISTSNFSNLREKLNQSEKRKLVRPTKFMKKYFNVEKRIRATYSHFPMN